MEYATWKMLKIISLPFTFLLVLGSSFIVGLSGFLNDFIYEWRYLVNTKKKFDISQDSYYNRHRKN